MAWTPASRGAGWASSTRPRRARCTLVDVSVATSSADADAPDRLLAIADAIDAAIAKHRPDAVAMERVFAQHNVRTVMGTGQVSGLVMVAARRAGLPVVLYTPSEVKAAVTGSGRADKAQVAYMVAKLLGARRAAQARRRRGRPRDRDHPRAQGRGPARGLGSVGDARPAALGRGGTRGASSQLTVPARLRCSYTRSKGSR